MKRIDCGQARIRGRGRAQGQPCQRPLQVSMLATAMLVAACSSTPTQQSRSGPAIPGTIKAGACESLAAGFTFRGVVVSEAAEQPASNVKVGSIDVRAPVHCLIRGRMNERTSEVDGKVYSIGFEMRLPQAWNGRYLYQGNGGIDGVVVPAVGPAIGGGASSRALSNGFAVLSSDAGHSSSVGPFFGIDPKARLDYGYQAVGTLTPMAKSLIAYAYGRAPDRSYIAGCSNGGRHAMVAAARYSQSYDGFLAGNPGFNLPKAAVAQLYGVQQYARVASADDKGKPDLKSAVTAKEFAMIGTKVLEKCDALDGAKDGMVLDTVGCQKDFDLARDVPTCKGARDGTCLSEQQKGAIANVLDGASDSRGYPIYAPFWVDPGIAGRNWAFWELSASVDLDPGAVAFIFQTPPALREEFMREGGLGYALGFGMDSRPRSILTTNSRYTVASNDFMTPPGVNRLASMVERGGKLLVYHGVADAVFSPADTVDWYRRFDEGLEGQGDEHARVFLVPQMNHCSGGPSTDRFDMLGPLVKWVEEGIAPAGIEASARTAETPLPNDEVPQAWSANRTRPLCPFPKFAKYKGSGDIESAASFYCAAPGS